MEVLFQDAHLLAVNKPSGLLTHRGWANDRDNALTRARALAGRYVYPAHRLDRATSGVLVFALSPEVAAQLGRALQEHGWGKRYLALVRGTAQPFTDVDHPITTDDENDERKPARTLITRLGTLEDEARGLRCSLVSAQPITGRAHQIRKHCKHISHPVLGDTRYGHGRDNRAYREHVALHRLALHAAQLAFAHPVTGERLQLRAQLPSDLAEPLDALGLLALANAALAAPLAEHERAAEAPEQR